MKENNGTITLEEILKYNSNSENNIENANEINEVVNTEKIVFINNPLPVPKRKEHTGLDYSIKVSDADDFDIKDMTGMDFFDYE